MLKQQDLLKKWTYKPWYDTEHHTIGYGLEVLWNGLRCAMLGHNLYFFEAIKKKVAACKRCNGKWEKKDE